MPKPQSKPYPSTNNNDNNIRTMLRVQSVGNIKQGYSNNNHSNGYGYGYGVIK